jgi:16S rRNA G966 N2-methylase RsmD
VRADAASWLEAAAGTFDLVFLDAPYRLADRVGPEIDSRLGRVLADGARVVVESAARKPLRLESLEAVRDRRYGATQVTFYSADGK